MKILQFTNINFVVRNTRDSGPPSTGKNAFFQGSKL